MRIQLLIADSSRDYVEHLSRVLAEKYADMFEVSVCSEKSHLTEMLCHHRYDVALLSPALAADAAVGSVRLPLTLWDGAASVQQKGTEYIRKYQRISSIAGEILERCAEFSFINLTQNGDHAHITVCWSPAGGTGTTTASLAYAAQRVSEGKKTVYLNLEPFSSGPAFFPESGKSISTVFEKLDGQVELLLQGIRQEDSGSGICYFCRPDNYEDISLLTAEDVAQLVKAAASGAGELVVDLGSVYDQRTAALLELADTVLLVTDRSRVCQTKWKQFLSQHNLYAKIHGKSVLVANRGAKGDPSHAASLVNLPTVQSEDPAVVYKTLSAGYFAG